RGRLWVADFGTNRIRIFDREGGLLGGWGGRGSGVHQLREPCGVAIHGDSVYVADTWNGRVQMFTLAGEWKAVATGLYGPRAVAVAPDGTVWASDTGNHSLVAWDSTLANKKTFGKAGSRPGDFSSPVGVAASSGAVYVADVGNRRIQVLAPSGQFRAAWPFPGWKEGGEAHLEADGDRVYASDPAGGAVLAFDATGKVLERWTAGESARPFSRPTGLALDAKARLLYVVNSGDNSVARIDLSRARSFRSLPGGTARGILWEIFAKAFSDPRRVGEP
ncbi:MAG: NHL repeat-containing protein, partial [Acidobacteriota bacterium]|nr:NHL repeat-containing protein [Acidobacteriota bacterium]